MVKPATVIRPTELVPPSENQRAPSGPRVMNDGRGVPPLLGAGIGNSVITPAGVILPIEPRSGSVNHKFPSGPATSGSDVATATVERRGREVDHRAAGGIDDWAATALGGRVRRGRAIHRAPVDDGRGPGRPTR